MKLAIKGHATHSKKVIEILEMLGGNNANNHYGNHCDKVYYINENGYINWDFIFRIEQHAEFIIFSLEEFLEKFPYKVGDKVYYDNKVCDVIEMLWNSNLNNISYGVCNDKIKNLAIVEELQPYKEETMEESINDINKEDMEEIDIIEPTTEINLNHPCFDGHNEIELIIPNGWKFEQRGDKMFGIRKQYPKTYEECCKVLMGKTNFQDFELVLTKLSININEENSISPEPPHITSINNLYKLLICRDAYWKIAGDWEPDWKNGLSKFCITIHEDQILICSYVSTNFTLAFPTEEMRNAFYENFKDLIEQCKELL